MTVTLLSKRIWERIRSLSRMRGPRLVAVPFVGAGASLRLPLRGGDVLIARVDLSTVRAGLTDPREIVTYIKRGVEVHNVSNLHAKVFVLGNRVVIGSTNVSQASEQDLLEAAVEIGKGAAVQEAAAFVRSLRGEIIELAYAKSLVKEYRPPRQSRHLLTHRAVRRSRPTPKQTNLWAVPLVEEPWEPKDHEEEKKAIDDARKRLKHPRVFEIETFLWLMPSTIHGLERGHRILQCIDTSDGKTMLSSPGRVLGIRRYHARGRERAIICLEIRRRLRRIALKRFLKKVGPIAKPLRSLQRPKQIHDPALVLAIGQTWPKVGTKR